MSRFAGFLLVWRNTVVTALRGKRLLILALLAALPLLVAWANVTQDDDVRHSDFVFCFMMVICQVTLPFGALFLGVAVLGDEIDGRTITFLFTRPLPRTVFYFGRLAGFFTAFGLLVTLSTFLCGQIYKSSIDITMGQIGAAVLIALAGALAYMCFFAALRAFTRKAILAGFVVTFILEFMLSKFPAGNGAQLTIWHHLSRLTANVFKGQAELDGPLGNLRDLEGLYEISPSVNVLVGVVLISSVLGAYVVKTREINVPATVA